MFLNDAIFHALNDIWHSIHGQRFAGASICDTPGTQRGIPLFANQVLLLLTYFSWVPAVIWRIWNTHNWWLFSNLSFFFFSNTQQTRCLSDSEIFQISRSGGSLILTIFKRSRVDGSFDYENFQISRTDGSLILKVLKYPEPGYHQCGVRIWIFFIFSIVPNMFPFKFPIRSLGSRCVPNSTSL